MMIWGILTASFVWFFFSTLSTDEDGSDEF